MIGILGEKMKGKSGCGSRQFIANQPIQKLLNKLFDKISIDCFPGDKSTLVVGIQDDLAEGPEYWVGDKTTKTNPHSARHCSK
jgi:hypothetical protein